MRLENKLAVVTGSAHGIGRAIAATFAREGAQVVLADVDAEAGRAVERELNTCGDCAMFVETDVADAASVCSLFAWVGAKWPRIDVLMNNAGITLKRKLEEATEEDWDLCLETNLRSAWRCVREALPLMKKSAGASIITIGSTHAFRTAPGFFPYAISKGGLESLSRYLAVEYGPLGIRSNIICPGMIRSRRTKEVLEASGDPEEAYRRILESHPLRRIGEPDDVARMALFLASDDASYVTGTTMVVDGGRNAQALSIAGLRKEELCRI